MSVPLMEDHSKELAKQIEGLHFTEEELQGVAEIEELDNEPIDGEEKWVVGKLISPRIVDGPLLIRVYFLVWKPQLLEEATSLGPNMFLFKFKKAEDKDFVLGRYPWTVDGELLALKSFDMLLTPKEYDFHPLPIWARIYVVPLGYMNRKVGEAIGNKFGKRIATNLRDDMGCAGEYLRLRIEMDCSKPLKRCMMLGRNIKSEQPRVCMFKYERLPRFCFYCVIIGHEHQLCLDKPEGNLPPFQYGDWLRVKFTNAMDVNRKKSRPRIVYAPKVEPDGNGRAVAIDQLGHFATAKAKSKSAKRALKEKSEGKSLKNLKKEKVVPCPSFYGVEDEQEVVSPPKAPISLTRSKQDLLACMALVIDQESIWIENLLISCKGNLNCRGYWG
ncbi:hypothetical protein GQ457_16G011650 [Hibiscus cannabinus]